MTRIFQFVILSLILSACASKQHFDLAEYERFDSPPYPAISFTINDGYVASDSGCGPNGCYSYRDNSDFAIMSALKESNLFQRVDINNAYSEHVLDIKFYDSHVGSDALEYSKILLGAATLFLVPTTSKKETHFSVSIRNKNTIIRTYSYQAEYTKTSSIFIDPQSAGKNAIDYFVSLMLSDIEKDGVFENENSSNGNTTDISNETTVL